MAITGSLMLTDKDNVATALEEIEANTEVAVRLGGETTSIKSLEKVPFGFKMAVADITKGAHVLKYGESIGIASTDIKKGEMVHIHNLEGGRGRGDLEKGDSK